VHRDHQELVAGAVQEQHRGLFRVQVPAGQIGHALIYLLRGLQLFQGLGYAIDYVLLPDAARQFPVELLHGRLVLQPFGKVQIVLQQPLFAHHPFQGDFHLVEVEGFDQEIAGALAHGVDGRVQGGIAGHHHHGQGLI